MTRRVKRIPQSIFQKITLQGSTTQIPCTWCNTNVHVFIDRVHCHHKKAHPQAADTGDRTKIRGTPITHLISMADSPQGWSSSLGVWVGYGMFTS